MTIHDLENFEIGRKLIKLCSKRGWTLDGLVAFSYRLPQVINSATFRHERSKNLLKLRRNPLLFWNDVQYPVKVDRAFVKAKLSLTQKRLESFEKNFILEFDSAGFISGELIKLIKIGRSNPSELPNKFYSIDEVCAICLNSHITISRKTLIAFGKKYLDKWTKQDVVKLLKTKLELKK
jgi:hypothetical protein